LRRCKPKNAINSLLRSAYLNFPSAVSRVRPAAIPRADATKLVISGVPCSGKTRFGDWLRDEKGFTHVDLEPRQITTGTVTPPQITPALVRWLATLSVKTVVTWGFAPSPESFEVLRLFHAAGFTPWWFEGDHEISRRCYVERDGEVAARQCFDPQKWRIVKASAHIAKFYRSNRLTTLTANGVMNFPNVYEQLARQMR
jgi:hypothetical protein